MFRAHFIIVLLIAGLFIGLLGCGAQDAGKSSTNQNTARFVSQPGSLELGFAADMAQAEALSRQTGKPLLIWFSADWCHYCHALAADLRQDQGFQELTRRFVCVRVDADSQPTICDQHRVRNFPTLLAVGSQGQLLARVIGKQPAVQVNQQLIQGLTTWQQARIQAGIDRR